MNYNVTFQTRRDKMLFFGLILLGPMTVLAINHGVNPGSNLIFNFEQLRRDQPPQIEMRDESLGLYMHRRPQTTTTTIAPIVVPEIPKTPSNDLKFSNPIPHVNNEYSYQYNPVPLPSTPIPVPRKQNQIQYAPWPSPPPAPQWSDLSEAFKKQGFPHYESQKPFQNQQAVPDFTSIQQQQMTTPFVPKQQEQKMHLAPEFTQALHRPQPPTSSAQMVNHHSNDFKKNPVQTSQFYPTAAPVSKPITQATQHPASRGSHRFNWDDLTTQPSWSQTSQQVTTTTVRTPAAKVSGPHPIPTLTPWSDGF